MNLTIYLEKFKKTADRIDKKPFTQRKLKLATGVYQDSVFLKIYKPSWANALENPLTAESRIFFSIWTNDSALQQQRILYNIHAFKLRKLKGYSIESRKFASVFRRSFQRFEHKWPNVSVKFGPLTLLQGWLKADTGEIQNEIMRLANNFLEIEFLIDNTLDKFRHP